MKLLVTGVAGFIGAALTRRLLDRSDDVVGIDNLNNYYDVELKKSRLSRLTCSSNFVFQNVDITDRSALPEVFKAHEIDTVVNLAAQAGVRYSIDNPTVCIDTNLVGFANILESCHQHSVAHLVYASSSSVYGSNTDLPFSETDNVDRPISLYAATKKANELMAHVYSHLYRLPTTGLRFFTVYGPWGRPDMALFRFADGILKREPIPVYNKGEMIRDFTYIDDIVGGVVCAIDRPPEVVSKDDKKCELDEFGAPYKIYNIGNSKPIELISYIQALERALGIKAKLELLPMQPGDVRATEADISRLVADLGYSPQIDVGTGVARFVEWYCDYYGIQLSD